MKNKIMKLALLLTCGLLTPAVTTATEFNQLSNPSYTQDTSLASGVIYLKAESNNKLNGDQIEPDFGLGYRHRFGHHGADISATSRWGDTIVGKDQDVDANYINLGSQVNYLYYFTTSQVGSFYTGLGLGNDHTRLSAEGAEGESEQVLHVGRINSLVTFGYQHGLNDTFSTFLQAQISQATSGYVVGHDFSMANRWQPTLTFSAGIGF